MGKTQKAIYQHSHSRVESLNETNDSIAVASFMSIEQSVMEPIDFDRTSTDSLRMAVVDS
jgi:hypothetical protein